MFVISYLYNHTTKAISQVGKVSIHGVKNNRTAVNTEPDTYWNARRPYSSFYYGKTEAPIVLFLLFVIPSLPYESSVRNLTVNLFGKICIYIIRYTLVNFETHLNDRKDLPVIIGFGFLYIG